MKWLINGAPLRAQSRAMELGDGRMGYNYWMDVGLGKTPLSLNEFANLYNEDRADYHVIITINNFKGGWLREHAHWGAVGKLCVWPFPRLLDPLKYEGCVMNWEALIGSGGDALFKIMEHRRVYLTFDEGHKMKSRGALVTKRSVELYKESAARRNLTGTPMSKEVSDLYVPLRLAGALEGMNPVVFRNRYAVMGGFKGKQETGYNPDRVDELDRLIDANAFRATKAEYTDLPPQIYMPTIDLDLPPKLKKHYREMEEDMLTQLDTIGEEPTFAQAEMVVTKMIRLQQISSGFVADEFGELHQLCPFNEVPKWKAVTDVYEGLTGRSKLLVFTNFVASTDALVEHLRQQYGPHSVAVLRGKRKKLIREDPDEEKAKFNQGDAQFLVGQISVAGTAHTLLGSKDRPCHTAMFAETTYNYIDRTQAEGRPHRHGQIYPVAYYDVASSPVERDAIEAMVRKKDLVASVVDKRRKARGG